MEIQSHILRQKKDLGSGKYEPRGLSSLSSNTNLLQRWGFVKAQLLRTVSHILVDRD